MKRVQNYLALEEAPIDKFVEKAPAEESEHAIKIDNKSFSWGLKTQDIDDIFDKIYDEWKGTTNEKKYRTEEEQKDYEEKQKKKAEEKKKQNKLDNIVALKNIDLNIKKGELVFVIGKVGAGKSTLLSSMIGDLLPVT
jgi:ABC-type bacteriocin/lantibiotic exporter with double-glycine peptidase domain